MTARKYNTDQWTPTSFAKREQPEVTTHTFALSDLKFRHFLFLGSLFLFLLAPIVWIITGQSGIALIIVGIGGVFFGFSALLVPSQIYHLNDER